MSLPFSFPFKDPCCWKCVACREDSVVVEEDRCQQCPMGYEPSQTKDQVSRISHEKENGK